MKCPFCGNEVENVSTFCPNCGQAITQTTHNTTSVSNYWNDSNDVVSKADKAQKERAAKLASEQSKRRSSALLRVILVGSILAALIIAVVAKNASNQKALEYAHNSMIGEEYGDTSEGSYWVGSSLDRRVVTIIDDNTLKFVEGNYRSYMNDQNNVCWSVNEIDRTDTFSYELSISFWGEVTIHFAGAEFEVYINEDDGSVRGINLY